MKLNDRLYLMMPVEDFTNYGGGGGGGGGSSPIDGCANPPKAGELSDWAQFDYDLDARAAAKLGFVFGATSVTASQRLLIREFARSSICNSNGKTYRYGTSVRLIVRINMIAITGSLSLSMVAAETQVGRMQAESHLNVVGYVGNRLANMLPPFRTFNVDAYAEMSTKMNDIKRLIGEDVENIRPVKLGIEYNIKEDDIDLNESLGLIWGLTQLSKGHSCSRAKEHYPDSNSLAAIRAIERAYIMMPGSTGIEYAPTPMQKAFATEVLRGMELRG
jgi:hypothetical protein